MNTESNRLEEGFEYSFMDEDVVAKKYNAVRLAEEYNSLGIDDIDKTYGLLKEILGSVGEEVYINTPFALISYQTIILQYWMLPKFI